MRPAPRDAPSGGSGSAGACLEACVDCGCEIDVGEVVEGDTHGGQDRVHRRDGTVGHGAHRRQRGGTDGDNGLRQVDRCPDHPAHGRHRGVLDGAYAGGDLPHGQAGEGQDGPDGPDRAADRLADGRGYNGVQGGADGGAVAAPGHRDLGAGGDGHDPGCVEDDLVEGGERAIDQVGRADAGGLQAGHGLGDELAESGVDLGGERLRGGGGGAHRPAGRDRCRGRPGDGMGSGIDGRVQVGGRLAGADRVHTGLNQHVGVDGDGHARAIGEGNASDRSCSDAEAGDHGAELATAAGETGQMHRSSFLARQTEVEKRWRSCGAAAGSCRQNGTRAAVSCGRTRNIFRRSALPPGLPGIVRMRRETRDPG